MNRIARRGYTPTKRGCPKGTLLAHSLWNKGVVCYLLSWLAGRMGGSLDGNARFARQESGQGFVIGNEKKLGGFTSGSGYMRFRV